MELIEKKRVLIVEDEEPQRVALENLLNDEGYSVISTKSGAEAVDKLKIDTFDLIIADIRLGDFDGTEILKKVKREECESKVILITAFEDLKTTKEAVKFGAYEYISKPIDEDELILTINNALYEQSLERKNKDWTKLLEKTVEERTKELKKSEEMYRNLFEDASDGIVVVDSFGIIKSVNKRFEEMCGYDREELLESSFLKYTVHEFESKIKELFEDGLRGKIPDSFVELEIMHKDARKVPIEVNGSVVKESGEVARLQAIVRDITERKRLVEELKMANAFSGGILDSMLDGMIVVDLQGNVVTVNKAYEEMTGYRSDELIGRFGPNIPTIKPEDRRLILDVIDEVIKKGNSGPKELIGLKKDGAEIPTSFTASTLKNEEGKIVALFAIIRDISETKRTEEMVKESQRKYSTLIERANDGVVVVQEGTIKFANAKFADLLGFSSKSLEGKNFFELLDSSNAHLIKELYENRMMGRKAPSLYHSEFVTNKGKKIPFEANCIVIKYEGKIAELTYIRDLRERQKIEYPLELFLAGNGRLTDRQREIIRTALEQGFYEYPKKIILEELAEEFDISTSTISEIIRRGEKNILKHYFGL
ncbi:MAG: PAS domain S-box protein [Halobacteriota archaeon]|nr:PAS domain S-box protein [Halobacteriota archaeon]